MSFIKEITNIPKPDWLRVEGGEAIWNIKGLKPINIIFGKNGSGKSNLLKNIASKREEFVTVEIPEQNKSEYFKVSYKKTSPERGGVYQTDGNISTSISNDPNYISSTNLENENRQFRQIVASGFERLLANLALHSASEVGDLIDGAITKLGTLIPAKYYIEKSATNLVIKRRSDGQVIPFNNLSSGEKEMFSLGLDCITKILWVDDVDHKVLLIDEPDVHVHPDLQSNFLDFLNQLTSEYGVQFILATHSLTFLAAANTENTAFIFMREGAETLTAFSKPDISSQLSLLLSNSLMTQLLIDNRIVLIEGPDDHQIWTQAIRSSRGTIGAYFQVCGSKEEILKYERAADEILRALTDGSRTIISLRDRDTSTASDFNDVSLPSISRHLTACHEIENLILSDEILAKYHKDRAAIYRANCVSDDIKAQTDELWAAISDRSNSSWQIVVGEQLGQALYIAKTRNTDLSTLGPTNILTMLGIGFASQLLATT